MTGPQNVDKLAAVGFVTYLSDGRVHPRLVPALFALAAVVYACGPRPAANEAHARRPETGARPLAPNLAVSLRDGVEFDFRLTNEASRKVEVSFPSGLTHDFEVQDSVGRVVWRWSEGRLFTQAMQNHILERDESLRWRAHWSPTDRHGEHVAIVSVRSSSHPVEQRVRFTLP